MTVLGRGAGRIGHGAVSSQDNAFQTDVQYRGFTSSPVNGQPQGLAVYQKASASTKYRATRSTGSSCRPTPSTISRSKFGSEWLASGFARPHHHPARQLRRLGPGSGESKLFGLGNQFLVGGNYCKVAYTASSELGTIGPQFVV